MDKPAFKGGGSPLAIATWMGHTDIMRQLLAAGADPHAVSAANDGDTPILIAERSGDAEVMKVLGLEVADQGVNVHFPHIFYDSNRYLPRARTHG